MKIFRYLALALLLFSGISVAKSLYVDDTLRINMRTGPETKYRIVKSITSGVKVDVLEEDKTSGWTKIREPGGVEGWVPSRFLVPEPIARDKLKAALEKLALLEDKSGSLGARFEALRSENTELKAQNAALQKENTTLSAELQKITAISENAINLDTRNRELQQENIALKQEITELQAEVQRLQGKKESDMLLAGGALVGAGILIALILPAMKPTRKSDTWV